jgi:hypothetical protein
MSHLRARVRELLLHLLRDGNSPAVPLEWGSSKHCTAEGKKDDATQAFIIAGLNQVQRHTEEEETHLAPQLASKARCRP